MKYQRAAVMAYSMFKNSNEDHLDFPYKTVSEMVFHEYKGEWGVVFFDLTDREMNSEQKQEFKEEVDKEYKNSTILDIEKVYENILKMENDGFLNLLDRVENITNNPSLLFLHAEITNKRLEESVFLLLNNEKDLILLKKYSHLFSNSIIIKLFKVNGIDVPERLNASFLLHLRLKEYRIYNIEQLDKLYNKINSIFPIISKKELASHTSKDSKPYRSAKEAEFVFNLTFAVIITPIVLILMAIFFLLSS